MDELGVLGHPVEISFGQAGGERVARGEQAMPVGRRLPTVHRRHARKRLQPPWHPEVGSSALWTM
jgi:hypothetical protein